MSTVLPFAACYTPDSATAARVSSLPYDVMNREEAAKMAEGNPDNFLRVTRSEIELPATTDAYSPAVYEQAAKNWQRLKSEVLAKDTKPCYYVYSLVMDGRTQTGVVATVTVDEYDRGIVRRHEKTRKEKEDDRTRHITALRAQTGPVFLTCRDSKPLADLIAKTTANAPLFSFTADDGIQHTGWRVPAEDNQALAQAFQDIPILYIADGHHRAASASRTFHALQDAGKPLGEADRFQAVIFPAGQLKILAYNRLLFNLNGLTPQQFLDKLGQLCPVTKGAAPVPTVPATVSLYLGGEWYGVDFRSFHPASAIDRLDVSLLQDLVLRPMLGIEDPRTSKSIDFVGGIRGTAELERRVDSGEAVAAFSMYPTTLDQLMEIADENGIMPPKSTWFEPKLRDGLFVHEI